MEHSRHNPSPPERFGSVMQKFLPGEQTGLRLIEFGPVHGRERVQLMRSYLGRESIDFMVDGHPSRIELEKGSSTLMLTRAAESAKPAERLLNSLAGLNQYQIIGSMRSLGKEGWIISQSHQFLRVDIRSEGRQYLINALKSDTPIELGPSALPFSQGRYQRLGSSGALVTVSTPAMYTYIMQIDVDGSIADARSKRIGVVRSSKVEDPKDLKALENVASMALVMAYEKLHQDPLSYVSFPPRRRRDGGS